MHRDDLSGEFPRLSHLAANGVLFAPIGATDAECGRARMTQARVKARNLSQAISYQPRTLLGRSFQEPTLQARYCMQISFTTRTFDRLGLKALPFVATLLAASLQALEQRR